MGWDWRQIAPYFDNLLERPLSSETIETWLLDWSRLSDLMIEAHARRSLALNLDTTDKDAELRFNAYLDDIYPASQSANQKLKEKLLDSELAPQGLEIPLRKMRVEAEIFHLANLPLLAEEQKMSSRYNRISGAQTVAWQGEERTMQQMRRLIESSPRELRERAWRKVSARQLYDRQNLNQLWSEAFTLRCRLAKHAGCPDYRAYRWKQMARLDYTPEHAQQFHQAILKVAVPAAVRVYDRYRLQLGVSELRPWDLDQDLYPLHQPGLPLNGDVASLRNGVREIFTRLDPQLGRYFETMCVQNLLSLENWKGKAPGAFCTGFPVQKSPFIFMNATGSASDVVTLLHESGHAFHNYERFTLPYTMQRTPGLEFAEVASMAMELLAAPYLEQAGLFREPAARQFRIQHLEHIILFWPYMAVVDGFQHWAYLHPEQAAAPENCDACWSGLWQEFMPGVDWRGLETEAATGWQRKPHIFRTPFYYLEYGLAQLGAVMVWRNAQKDPQMALQQYRMALSRGGTLTLPDLYHLAGARLAFDEQTLAENLLVLENTLAELVRSAEGNQL